MMKAAMVAGRAKGKGHRAIFAYDILGVLFE